MHFPFKIPDNKDFDVVGFGTNAVDFLITVPEYPAFTSKVELGHYVRAAGGEVATTMVGLRRLGIKPAYAGRFGDDDAGSFGIKSLADEGVDLRFAAQIAGAETQIAFIIIDERTGERTVIWKRDEKLAYSESDAPVDAVDLCRVLHITPHDSNACKRMAERAWALGVVVSLDIDNVFDGVEELLPLVDILIVSAEFPVKLLGINDPKSALTEIRSRFGNAITGITLGEQGSLLLCGETFVQSPGFEVPGGCKDTTGAGDAFRAGLLYGLLNGDSVEESARMANAVAALKCRKVGARTALPDKTELAELLRKT